MRFLTPLLLLNLVSLNASVVAPKNRLLRNGIQYSIQDSTDECEAIFHELDANNDATLTRVDLETILLGYGFAPDEKNDLLSEVNNDATVSMAEFCSGGRKKEAVVEKKEVVGKQEKTTLKQKLSGFLKKLEWSAHECPGAFNERDHNNDNYIRMRDVEDALDDYGVPESEQNDLFDRYGSYSRNDYISYEDFDYYFCEFDWRGENDDPQTLTDHQCPGAFDNQDSNNDGRIRMSDVEEALEENDIPRRDIDTLLDWYGASSDDYIDYDDFEDNFCGGNKKK